MWWFQDEEAVRCVATGLRVLNISLLDQEQTEFLDAGRERLRWFQQAANYMMEDRLKGASPAKSIVPGGSGCGGASLPHPGSPRVWQQDSIHSARQNVNVGLGVASFVSARAGVSGCRGANTSGASTESARAGTFDTCYDGTRAACTSAEGAGADGTNAAAQCSVSWG